MFYHQSEKQKQQQQQQQPNTNKQKSIHYVCRVDPCILDPLKNMADCGETRSCMHSELIRHERGLLNARIDRIL